METVTCKRCGSIYELDYDRTISREKEVLKCRICGEVIHESDEAKIWKDKLIKTGKIPETT